MTSRNELLTALRDAREGWLPLTGKVFTITLDPEERDMLIEALSARPEALPKEPTQKMLEAMVNATWDMDHSDLKWKDAMRIARRAYSAMLAARPVPFGPEHAFPSPLAEKRGG